jgi:hypothetical protein
MKSPSKKYITNILTQVEELKEILIDVSNICRRIVDVDNMYDLLYMYDQTLMDDRAGVKLEGKRAFVRDIFDAHDMSVLGDGAYRVTGGYKGLVFKAAGVSCDDNDVEFRQYKNMLRTNMKYLAIPLLAKMTIRNNTILIFPKADIGEQGKGAVNIWRFDELESNFCDMHSGNYGTFMGMVFATDFGGHDYNYYKGHNVSIPEAKRKKFDKVLAPIFELQKKTLA